MPSSIINFTQPHIPAPAPVSPSPLVSLSEIPESVSAASIQKSISTPAEAAGYALLLLEDMLTELESAGVKVPQYSLLSGTLAISKAVVARAKAVTHGA